MQASPVLTTYEPILACIEGIDNDLRYLSSQEVANLIKVDGSSKGDWFAQWLAKTPETARELTLRSLLTSFSGRYFIFGVADGLPVKYDHKNEDNPLNSVNRHMRFLCVILPDAEAGSANIVDAVSQRTIFAVAGHCPDANGKLPISGDFLQCVSWDPHAFGKGKGMGRFYQRNTEGWVFFGDGFNAFNSQSTDRGAFDGHIGGALIMKELQRPWTHWYDGGNAGDFVSSLGSTPDKGSACDPHNVLYDPLFTATQGTVFGLLISAEQLQRIVEKCIPNWYKTRFPVYGRAGLYRSEDWNTVDYDYHRDSQLGWAHLAEPCYECRDKQIVD
ncbi:hypothetical protein BDN72DRAFT_491738 [Pluteus cervinus]|uniref:Uncharacterized protein n=1 Tax=Pluteus cervinus TaxID=181527 RepID=A0ACD3AZ70_9AGAR|nr:hypothetical protein BDN72DRAFT_491738 [Pluteus cervinus]